MRLSRTLLSAIVIATVSAGGALAQTEGPGRALVASNVLKLAADTTRSGFSALKEFRVPHAGTVRLRYQFRSDGVGTVSVSVGSALETNSACGASTSSTTFQTKTCEFKVVAGDRIQVLASPFFIPPDPMPTPFLRNVRLFWDVVNATSTGSVLID